LRQVDVLVAQGTPVADAIRAIGVTEVILRGVPGHIRSDNVLRREGGRRTGQQVSVRECALAA
jgi:hypothetical protein